MPGPAPKRDIERTRTATPASGAARQGELLKVRIPAVDKNWHPRAKEFYNALKTSGQRDYYQNSDWAYARMIADYMTMVYSRPRAMDWANLHTMMGRLGVTEGDRRQILRVELDASEAPDESAEDAVILSFQAMLTKKKAG